ncbi:MAG: hypothetical protein KDE27_06935 [Planctomycetes bacterium]|nr:hypothetical protein [Planctomycetota bacterium]
MNFHLPTLCLGLAGAIGLVPSLAAQSSDGPYWSEYTIPAGSSGITALGTLAFVTTPTAMHLYSGMFRDWLVFPVSSPVVLGNANAYLLFQDGSTFHGYCTRTHKVRSITTSGAAAWSIGSNTSSWTAYVQDGNTVYGWSGFLGEWQPLTIQGTLHTIEVGSHSLMVADDVNLYGFSAFHGTWVATPNRTGGSYSSLRNGGMARYSGPDEVVAFSSYQNAWSSTTSFASPLTASLQNQDGYAALSNNADSDILWFSTMTGTFVETHEPAGAIANHTRNCAVLVSSNGTFGYSPAQGSVVSIPGLQPNPLVSMATGIFGSYAFVDDGAQLVGFSGLTGTAASPASYDTFAFSQGDCAGLATGSGTTAYAYSAMLGQWFTAPAVAVTASTPSYEAIVRQTATGFEGFSARSGRFTNLGNLTPAAYRVGGGASSLVMVVDGGTVHAFDALIDQWVPQAIGANPVASVFRLTGLVYDSATAYGYSLFTHTWDDIALQGVVATANANSSIAYVTAGNYHYTYTANGSLSNYSRFPEFSRFVVRGGELVHLQLGNPGAFVAGLFSFQPVQVSSTPYGTLYLDPNAIAFGIGFVPADGILRSPIAIPTDPTFSGLVLNMQDVVIHPNGQIGLSNHQAPYLW